MLSELGRVACAAVRDCALADLGFEQNERSIAQCEAMFAEAHAYMLVSPSVTYDPVAAAPCLAAFDTAACEIGRPPVASALEWPIACRDALSGTLALDAACTSNAECASGQCSCAGACIAAARLGEPCVPAPCAAGLMCDATAHCIASPPVAHVGDACGPTSGCFGALRCSDGVCHEGRDLRQASLGDPCVNPFDFTSDVDPTVICARGLWCDFDNGSVCVAAPAEGDPCLGQGTCPEGFACQGSPSVCAPVQALGGDCPNAYACGPRLVCVFSVCEAMKALGATCNGAGECFSGACVDGVCALPERALCP